MVSSLAGIIFLVGIMITPTFAADPDSYVILTPISVGKIPDGVVLNLETNRAYVPNTGSNTVTVIDTTTNTVIDTIKVGNVPWSIEVNSDTNRVYVVNKGSGTVSVIDTTTHTVIDTIEVGKRPFGIAVNPDTNRAYVPNTGSNTVSVIDTTTNTVIDTMEVGVAPKDIALNPLTNRIYVANSVSNNVSIIDLNTGEPVEEEIPISSESDVMPEEETPELPEQASEIAQNKVPEWIKNNAGWWADGAIGDSDFASGLEYLIKEKIILVSEQTISNFEDYYVVLHLNLGKIIIEFFPDEAPNHVEKFFELTQSGFYDGILFHRIIPGFMIQGGDPNTKTQDKSIWGTGGPGYSINEEFNSINHNRGIVSMARSADPDSAGSQFFIVHQDSRFLDGQYTVFGKIVTQESFDTLDKIASTPVGDSDIPKDPSETLINRTEIISKSETQESTINQEIPDWVKNNAKWWADGLISENEFLNGIKYMIEKGIIRV